MNEFEIIQHFFKKHHQHHRQDVILGIGDDAAILEISPENQLIVSIDTLVGGVHFPLSTTAEDIGHKALAVNLSDLAAMGAEPAWVTLALTMPHFDEAWLTDFCMGFFTLANAHRVAVIGGDTTRGPLSISVQAHGFVPRGKAITRQNAKPGDSIYVTNTLGDAGLALDFIQNQIAIKATYQPSLLERLNRPEARIQEGRLLRDIATAMIDISDGLLADLGHILEQSEVGAFIDVHQIPLSKALQDAVSIDKALSLALCAGDDYELCFTVPKHLQNQLENIMQTQSSKITCIGEITQEQGLRLRKIDGSPFQPKSLGYQHF
jgi:thiamine-monophosphate kinase